MSILNITDGTNVQLDDENACPVSETGGNWQSKTC